MLEIVKGNLFTHERQAMVNTVNCVGVMGKGIAKEFKKRYPSMYEQYRQACDRNELKPGKMWVYQIPELKKGLALRPEKYIICFPTKDDWHNDSKIEWVEQGLNHLIYIIGRLDIRSISIPALGCNNGNLKWKVVRHLMELYLTPISQEVDITIYQPL